MMCLMPIVVLLTISFFVLVVVDKTENKTLKIFGWVNCVLLWIAAAMILSSSLLLCGSAGLCGSFAGKGQCPIQSQQDWRTAPPQSGMYNPHMRGMRNNPHAGMMIRSKDDMLAESDANIAENPMGTMMGGADKQMKCPGMQGMKNMPAQPPATPPVEKK